MHARCADLEGNLGVRNPPPSSVEKFQFIQFTYIVKFQKICLDVPPPGNLNIPHPPPPNSPGKMDPHMTLFDLCSSFFENLNPIFNMNINWHINACVLDENITAMEVTLDWLNFN